MLICSEIISLISDICNFVSCRLFPDQSDWRFFNFIDLLKRLLVPLIFLFSGEIEE